MSNVTKKLMQKLRGRVSKDVIQEQEVEVAKQTLRIAKNTLVLLKQGLFSGQSAAAVMECQEWIDGLCVEIASKLPKEEPRVTEGQSASKN